jgi:NAD(P)H dehydrogenase (quinone)
MTTYAVTGATGGLGRRAVEELLDRGVPASDVVAVVRRPEAAADLAARGVQVRPGDYSRPDTLPAALAGVDRLLLVSGSEAGRRIPQHRNAIRAAKASGVEFIAYTSIVRADASTLLLAADHRGTEELLAETGVPHALLRNAWYFENYTAQLPVYLQHGIVGAAGEGRISAATRADYAEAAAAVLIGEGHDGAVYELGGEPFTMAELADAVSAATGRTVSYTDLPVEQYAQVLVGAGLPEPVATVLADGDRGAAADELLVEGSDLEKLLGRTPTSLTDAVATAAAELRA